MIARCSLAASGPGWAAGAAVLLAAGLGSAEVFGGGAGLEAVLPGPQVAKVAMAPPDSHALGLAISPDGKTLAAGCADRTVKLLDARSGEKIGTLTGVARGYVRGVAFTPDGKTVVGLGDDERLWIWDVPSRKALRSLPVFGDKDEAARPSIWPGAMALSPDGRTAAVGGGGTGEQVIGDDKTFFEVRALDLKTGGLAWSHVGRRGDLNQLAFSPDGRLLACAASLEARLLDARTGELKQTVKPKDGTVWAVAFSRDGRFLAGCGTAIIDGKHSRWLTVWDVRSGMILRSIEAGEAGGAAGPGTIAFSPDGKSLASAGVGIAAGRIAIGGRMVGMGQKVINDIRLWDVATGALKWTSPEGDLGNIGSVAFSPDGEAIFCCDDSATSRIDARTGQDRRDLLKANEGRAR